MSTNEDEAFIIVGADGIVTDLLCYNHSGGAELNEDVTCTLRRCAGGDVQNCAWADTVLECTITGANDATNVRCSDTGSVTVAAGDALTMKMRSGGSDPPDGTAEVASWQIQFDNDNDNESWISGGHDGGNRAYSVFGLGTPQSTSNEQRHFTPLPATFGVVQIHVGVEDDTSTVDHYLCITDGRGNADCSSSGAPYPCCTGSGTGTCDPDTNCLSSGREVMSCQTATAGASTCTSTSCDDVAITDCTYDRGDQLWAVDSSIPGSVETAMGVGLTNTEGRWMSGVCGDITDVSKQFFGWGAHVCPGSAEADCTVEMIGTFDALAMEGWSRGDISSGSIEITMNRNVADSVADCVLDSTDACAWDGTLTFSAGDEFIYDVDDSSTVGGTDWCVSSLWASGT